MALMRPQQWIKNFFVFAPGFFAFRLGDWAVLGPAFGAFGAFCLASSAIYALNDALDVEADRKHPDKCHRPVASGRLSWREAIGVATVCAAGAALFGVLLGWAVFGLLLVYGALNGAYCLWLKHVALVDVFCVAGGFLLRVFVGGAATGVSLSAWILVMTFLVALFLALAKRRDDVLLAQEGRDVRRAIKGYNLPMVDMALGVVAAVVLVAYLMYTMAPETTVRFGHRPVCLTALWVLLGLLRYFQRTLVFLDSGSPTKVFCSDRFLQGVVVLWVLSFLALGWRVS